jgi:glycosyltransferase involved in cell wall biosynthesis
LKILYIYKYGIFGGVCTQIFNRLSYLNEVARVDLLFFKNYGASRLFKENKIFFTDKISKISKIIHGGAYDFISIIDTPEALDALKHNHLPDTKVIIEVHTTTANISYLNDLRDNIERMDYISYIITPSEYLKERIENEFRFKNVKPVHIIPNTLDTTLFSYITPSIVPDRKIVLWVGKLDDHKNWQGFLEVAAMISDKNKECLFWIIGGYTAPKERIQEFIRMIDNLDLSEKVKWFPLIKYEHMPLVYSLVLKSGGCHLITSLNESFGMTMIEAISVGCPVISSNVGALPEVMNGISTDLLYDYKDNEQAAAKLQKVLDNQAYYNQLFENKKEIMRSEYSIETAARNYFQLLQRSL